MFTFLSKEDAEIAELNGECEVSNRVLLSALFGQGQMNTANRDGINQHRK